MRCEARIGRSALILETGKIAKQADGAVTVRYGDTIVLVTAVASKEPKPDIGYFPLTVEYREKTYAAGKIPGGFFKREGRPTESETLSARLIDRPIRPLFPNGYLNEVQVMGTVLSSDGENDPDVLGIIGASASLMLAGIPFQGPVAGVRVGRVNDQFILFPSYAEADQGTLDLVVVGTEQGVVMIEAGAKELPEAMMIEAIEFGANAMREIFALQRQLLTGANRSPRPFTPLLPSAQLMERVRSKATPRLAEINRRRSKQERDAEIDRLRQDLLVSLRENADGGTPPTDKTILAAFEQVEWEDVRRFILTQKTRLDGRRYDEIRPISCEVGTLPRTHGSSLFTRGQTQSLSVTTLGTSNDEQLVEALEGTSYRSFMLHYNFPPFSVGEIKPVRGPGRREIGHGALAERALRPMIPAKEQFPYTIRLVSEILESNGSSSMASVCAGTLALMDAGVPIGKPVAGIAMGLVHEGSRYEVLTDLSGLEDHHGDMDFKVAGTRDGITAIQLDLKIDHLPHEVIRRTLQQAHEARLKVLDTMLQTLDKPRPDISSYAPRIVTIKINPDKIRDVIGPGGKMIRKIIEETGATIDVEDDGSVMIASANEEKLNAAIGRIKALTEDPEIGKVYTGKIKRIMAFGAFCEILPGKEGLIHVSELADGYVESVESAVKLGDEVQVKVIEVDEQGRVNLSIRQLHMTGDPTPLQRPGGGRGRGGERDGGHRPGRPDGDRDSQREHGRDREQPSSRREARQH